MNKEKKHSLILLRKKLIKTIESFAKDIGDKYLDPPHTTDFGIMFLPIESLYAEVLVTLDYLKNYKENIA